MTIEQAVAAIEAHVRHYRTMTAVRAADAGGHAARVAALKRAAGLWQVALASLDTLDPIARDLLARELARLDPDRDQLPPGDGADPPASRLDQHDYAGALTGALAALARRLQPALAAAAAAEVGPGRGRPSLADEDWLVAQCLGLYERFTGHVPASTTNDGDSAFAFVKALLQVGAPHRPLNDNAIRDHIRRAGRRLSTWRLAESPSASPDDAEALALIRAAWTRPEPGTGA